MGSPEYQPAPKRKTAGLSILYGGDGTQHAPVSSARVAPFAQWLDTQLANLERRGQDWLARHPAGPQTPHGSPQDDISHDGISG